MYKNHFNKSFRFILSLLLVLLLTGCSYTYEQPSSTSEPVHDNSLLETEGTEASDVESSANLSYIPSDKTESEESNISENETIIDASDPSSNLSNDSSSDSELNSTESTEQKSSFIVKYLDVGQADASLIECDGHYMLIDGGDKSDSDLIYSVLKQNDIQHLDLVVATHPHEDHVGGLAGAFNYASSDLTICPTLSYDSKAFQNFSEYASKNGGGITIPSVGDSFSLGSATIDILAVNDGSTPDNSSIVLMISYGNTSFLFMGDAYQDIEQILLNRGSSLSATVLKVGHHGSDKCTSNVFLQAVKPKYAVISVGKDNSYGHPSEATLNNLKEANVIVFRTDLQGDIVAISDGKSVSISSEKTVSQDDVFISKNTIAPIIPVPLIIEKEENSSITDSNTDSQKNGTEKVSTEIEQTQSKEPKTEQAQSTESQTKTTKTTESVPKQDTKTEPLPVQDSEGIDYIININTKKFHYPDCKSVKQMKESNKRPFTGDRDDLISQGYSPCGNCHP